MICTSTITDSTVLAVEWMEVLLFENDPKLRDQEGTNERVIKECLVAWCQLILDVLYPNHGSVFNDSEGERYLNITSNFLSVIVPDFRPANLFLKTFVQHILHEKWGTIGEMKNCCDGLYPEHRRLLSPINKQLVKLFEPGGYQFSEIAVIMQFCNFAQKLPIVMEAEVEADFLAEYLDNEAYLATIIDDSKLTDELSDIIGNWFKDFSIKQLLPKHGPGSVAEGALSKLEKYQAFRYDDVIDALATKDGGSDSYYYYPLGKPELPLERTSKTIFVPKNMFKLRVISKEPASLQFLQQAVMYELHDYVAHHSYLRNIIKIGDQTQNRRMAMERFSELLYLEEGPPDGSIYTDYVNCTIDLSRASDTVRTGFVDLVFAKVPELAAWLHATRCTHTILPSPSTEGALKTQGSKGVKIPLLKFVTMGNAFCFMLECIIYAAIVERTKRARYRLYCHVPKDLRSVVLDHDRYSIVGDDIVCPNSWFSSVTRDLAKAGFLVNHDKTWASGRYRESCGVHVWDGYDVTWINYKVDPYAGPLMPPKAYEALASLANRAADKNLRSLRRFLLLEIKSGLVVKSEKKSKRCGLVPYFVEDTRHSPYLFSPQPTNFHATTCRWCSEWQVNLSRFTATEAWSDKSIDDNEDLLFFERLVLLAKFQRHAKTGATGQRDVASANEESLHGERRIRYRSTRLAVYSAQTQPTEAQMRKHEEQMMRRKVAHGILRRKDIAVIQSPEYQSLIGVEEVEALVKAFSEDLDLQLPYTVVIPRSNSGHFIIDATAVCEGLNVPLLTDGTVLYDEGGL